MSCKTSNFVDLKSAGLLCACFINRAGPGGRGGLEGPSHFYKMGAEPPSVATANHMLMKHMYPAHENRVTETNKEFNEKWYILLVVV
jgi:hypothetical protein